MHNKPNELSSRDIYISEEMIPIDAYQAIFYKITKKVDQLTNTYHGGYIIHPNDIINLDYYIQQMLKQYQVIGKNVEITHKLQKNSSKTFTDIQKFKIDNMSSRKITTIIAYQTEFMIKLPQEIEEAKNIIQRYKLSVMIPNHEIDENDMDAPSILRGFSMPPRIEVSLDFVDYAVAVAIQSTIEEWIDGLSKEKERKITHYVNKYEDKLETIILSMTMTMPFIGAIILIRYHNYNIASLFEISLFCIVSLIIFRFVTNATLQKISKYSTILRPRMKINFTLGDQDRINNMETKRKKVSNLMYFLFFGIFLNIFFNLLSSWLFTKIF